MTEIWTVISDGWKALDFSRINHRKAERKGVCIAPRIRYWIADGGCDHGFVDSGGDSVDIVGGVLLDVVTRDEVGIVACTFCVEGGGRAND